MKHDNMWFHMGLVEKIVTIIRLIVFLFIGTIGLVLFYQFFPDYLLINDAKQKDAFYPYYEEQYRYLENTVCQVLEQNNNQLDVTLLPSDIYYRLEEMESTKKAIMYIDQAEDISIEYTLSDTNQLISQESFRLSKEELQEKAKNDLNSLMGIAVLVTFFCVVAIGMFLYGSITFVIYVYER